MIVLNVFLVSVIILQAMNAIFANKIVLFAHQMLDASFV
jgi:hypothetical protein